jgi:hypothetical protein
MIQRTVPPLVILLLLVVMASCSKSPTTPTPPVVTPPPVVAAPVIATVTAAVTRAEAGQDVAITASVTDAAPAQGALTYEWSTNAGIVTGAGPSAVWRLDPGTIDVGQDVVVTLTVVKPYEVLEGGQIVTREHRVTAQTAPFRAHDSRAEISRIIRTFLIDYFGNSSIDPDSCLVDFSAGCAGRDAEYDDIVKNRRERRITSADARVDDIEFNAGATFAWIAAPCTFRDIDLATNQPDVAEGTCDLTAVYEQHRWWLCSSHYRPGAATSSRAPAGSGRYWE